MKRILVIVILCALYDIVAFEYQRNIGTDTMFSSLLLPVLCAITGYTVFVCYLTYRTSTLNNSIILNFIIGAPIYLYIAVHMFMLLILIVTGISAIFQS